MSNFTTDPPVVCSGESVVAEVPEVHPEVPRSEPKEMSHIPGRSGQRAWASETRTLSRPAVLGEVLLASHAGRTEEVVHASFAEDSRGTGPAHSGYHQYWECGASTDASCAQDT